MEFELTPEEITSIEEDFSDLFVEGAAGLWASEYMDGVTAFTDDQVPFEVGMGLVTRADQGAMQWKRITGFDGDLAATRKAIEDKYLGKAKLAPFRDIDALMEYREARFLSGDPFAELVIEPLLKKNPEYRAELEKRREALADGIRPDNAGTSGGAEAAAGDLDGSELLPLDPAFLAAAPVALGVEVETDADGDVMTAIDGNQTALMIRGDARDVLVMETRWHGSLPIERLPAAIEWANDIAAQPHGVAPFVLQDDDGDIAIGTTAEFRLPHGATPSQVAQLVASYLMTTKDILAVLGD